MPVWRAAPRAVSSDSGYNDSALLRSFLARRGRSTAFFPCASFLLVLLSRETRERAMANTNLESLIQQIRQLLADEYARGGRDAIAKIMQAAQGEAVTEAIKKIPPRRVRMTLAPQRAKRGAADALIERVLGERRHKGASTLEIQRLATSPGETAVSYSGLRFALERGREAGRYKNKDRKWFLVEVKAAEHQHAAE